MHHKTRHLLNNSAIGRWNRTSTVARQPAFKTGFKSRLQCSCVKVGKRYSPTHVHWRESASNSIQKEHCTTLHNSDAMLYTLCSSLVSGLSTTIVLTRCLGGSYKGTELVANLISTPHHGWEHMCTQLMTMHRRNAQHHPHRPDPRSPTNTCTKQG